MVILKFTQGAWVTLFVTGLLIVLCIVIQGHYQRVRAKLAELNSQLGDMLTLTGSKKAEVAPQTLDPKKQTAVLMVNAIQRAGHSLRC